MLFSVFNISGIPEIVNFTAFNKRQGMNINRLFIVLIAFVLLLSGCKKKNELSISGLITHAEGKTIYLDKLLVSSPVTVDSVKIDKKGEFKFKGEVGFPTFFMLKFQDNRSIMLLVDSAEQVVVNADYANFTREYSIQGSLGSIQVKELNAKLDDTRKKLDSLQSLKNLYKGAPEYEQLQEQWIQQSNNIINEQEKFSTNFVMNNPFSMASILALYQKLGPQNYVVKDLHTMRVAASALNSVYPESEHVKSLYQNTVQLLKEEKNAQLQKIIREQGENSPEIVLPKPDGEEVALSSLRGKIVLLHFWSALDKNSRIQNEALVEAYKKYHSKGFEIYQVSVDDNRIEWVDAIDKDKLNWINVGDMKGSLNAVMNYNIQGVPYNYLLDKEGIIISQNLKGLALDKALAGIFK